MPRIKAHADIKRKILCLKFGLSFQLHPCIVSAGSESFGDLLRRFASQLRYVPLVCNCSNRTIPLVLTRRNMTHSVDRLHTGQCKRTGGCYNELVVAFFSTGGGVKGKKSIPVDFIIYL